MIEYAAERNIAGIAIGVQQVEAAAGPRVQLRISTEAMSFPDVVEGRSPPGHIVTMFCQVFGKDPRPQQTLIRSVAWQRLTNRN